MAKWSYGDRVRVLACPADNSLVGMTGWVCKVPDRISPNPVLRVRLDGGMIGHHTEIDGTADKFERIT